VPERDEYCPITKSLDMFGDRWGLLLIREVLRGVTHFNELERNLPGISRSTLAQRLRHLEKQGLVERRVTDDGRGTEYEATDAGRDLARVINVVGDWGVRWLVPHPRPSHIDPDGLMVWVSRHVMLRELPAHRVVIRFELSGRSRRYFWLVLRSGEVSLCPEHPGFPEDLFITATPAALYLLVLGRQSLEEAMEEGTVRVEGPPGLIRSLPRWFILRAKGPNLGDGRSRRWTSSGTATRARRAG
jgi:DNA-binding HxlR family transcriptional regulator